MSYSVPQVFTTHAKKGQGNLKQYLEVWGNECRVRGIAKRRKKIIYLHVVSQQFFRSLHQGLSTKITVETS